MLDKFTLVTLKRHPRSITASKILALKNMMILALQLPDKEIIDMFLAPAASAPKKGFFRRSISSSGSQESDAKEEEPHELARSNSVASTEDRSSTSSSNYSQHVQAILSKHALSSYSLEAVTQLLDALVQSSSTTLSMASSLVGGSNLSSPEYVEGRKTEISERHFRHEERQELAKLLLRKFDLPHAFHCPHRNCGAQCEFRVEQCPHEHCFVYFSHKWWEEHDGACPEKPLPCERVCGETVLRKNMGRHLQDDCVLRPVTCPYQCVGCKVEGKNLLRRVVV